MDINLYKKKLEEELATLEKELSSLGTKKTDGMVDWEAKPADLTPDPADETELADSIEEFETNTAILKELEIRYNEVKDALARIEKGTYGVCEVGGEKIEEERLLANPAAKTCLKHK